jgi:ribosomal protein S18 acetylase RimI-like enzyme
MKRAAGIAVRMLEPGDASVLERVAPEVFDHDVDPELAREFLADPRHHLAIAIEDGVVVGFASGVHYVHPDKPAELFVNEVGVASTHRRRGIGRRLLALLFAHAEALGCREAWVATEPGNVAARRLYATAGGTEGPEPFVLVSFRLGGKR